VYSLCPQKVHVPKVLVYSPVVYSLCPQKVHVPNVLVYPPVVYSLCPQKVQVPKVLVSGVVLGLPVLVVLTSGKHFFLFTVYLKVLSSEMDPAQTRLIP
jgi:hypothetical protein